MSFERWHIGHTSLLAFGAALAAVGAMTIEPIGEALVQENEGSQMLLKQLDTNPSGLAFTTVISEPLREEMLFRILPSLLLSVSGRNGQQLAVGAASSAAFAFYHDVDWSTFTFHRGMVSIDNIVHFAAGMGLWSLTRAKGGHHALAAHSIGNATILGGAAVGRGVPLLSLLGL